jgi:hypothetical protein
MHYPFTLRQRKMWTYYVLVMSAIPILSPLTVALGRWLLPIATSAVIGISLLLAWTVAAYFILRRMSMRGGRLSRDT